MARIAPREGGGQLSREGPVEGGHGGTRGTRDLHHGGEYSLSPRPDTPRNRPTRRSARSELSRRHLPGWHRADPRVSLARAPSCLRRRDRRARATPGAEDGAGARPALEPGRERGV